MIGIDKIKIIDFTIDIDWDAFAAALPGDHVSYKAQGPVTTISGQEVNRIAWQSPVRGKTIAFEYKYNALLGRHMAELTLCPATILRGNNRQPVMSACEFLQAYDAARTEMAADGILLSSEIPQETRISYLEINTNLGLLMPYEAYAKPLRYIIQNIALVRSKLDKQIGTTLERGNKNAAWILYDKAAELAMGLAPDSEAALRIEYKLKTAVKVERALKDNRLRHVLQNWHIVPDHYAECVHKQILEPVAAAVIGDIKAHADHLRTYIDVTARPVGPWLAETQNIFDAENMLSAYVQVLRSRRVKPDTIKARKSDLRKKLKKRNQQPLRKGAVADPIIGQRILLEEILEKLRSATDRAYSSCVTFPTGFEGAELLGLLPLGPKKNAIFRPR